MPIKKKLPTPKPAAEKSPAPRAAPAKKVAAKKVTPSQPARVAQTDMGEPMDPSTLPGANESAPSLSGQRYAFTYSTSPNSKAIWVFEPTTNTSGTYWVWRQCGAAVVFEYKTARYVGRFEDGLIRGTASNTNNATWTWEATLADPKASGMQCFHSPI